MNRRTLKKHCRRAMPILIARHGYSAEAFTPAKGDETVDAPCGMESRHLEYSYMTPLAGTPLLCGHYPMSNDGDCFLPSEVLSEIELWEKFEPTDEDLAWPPLPLPHIPT